MELSEIFDATRDASRELSLIEQKKINGLLEKIADAAVFSADYILAENKKDLARMDASDPMYDRLLLTRERIDDIASDMRSVASLPSPVGEIMSSVTRPNGMRIDKVRVPFGVIGVIYEARPNVSFDVFSLCLKTKNAAVLKGGSNAEYSNKAIVEVIKGVLSQNDINENIITLLPATREATASLLHAVGKVDLLIPRGGKSLISYVRENAKIPVIETGAGICHTYFDSFGDVKKGAAIILNGKTRRVSVCNALDSLVIHKDALALLPELCKALGEKKVTIYADENAFSALEGKYPASLLQKALPEHFGTEFLDYKMAIKTVDSFEQAIEHITKYTSGHSEAIITENKTNAIAFQKRIDAACIYVNVPTSFTDGGQFGFGAEIGISTQKLHARGPMALPEITTYKYLITGDGQVRD
ncbi:MAG: glutamate-5-semialdehyde dehydrogenase [Flavobacteriales bacterium]|nr:glutamate-5-semialdehyde dehydrogenase [Flavobacteriales bacterium]